MPIRCTITSAGVTNEYGQTLSVGTVYTPNNDNYALSLIQQGKATDTDASLVDPGLGEGNPQNTVFVNAAAIAAPTAQMLRDFGTEYALDVAPFGRYRTNGTAMVSIPTFNGTSLVSGDGTTISFAGPAYTFANLPAASSTNAGFSARVTDVGRPGAGSIWISDGSIWTPMNGRTDVLKTVIPLILPSSGSFAANGAVTLNVALDRIYSSPLGGAGGCYMYFPAGAVFSGSAAGFYYTAMSSTTVGVVYNNRYTAGWPTVPTVPSGLVIAGPGAFAQTTGLDLTALTVTLPANCLGALGRIAVKTVAIGNGAAAGNRVMKAFLGAYQFHSQVITSTSNFSATIGEVSNAAYAIAQRQLGQDSAIGLVASTTFTPNVGTIDTTAAVDLIFTLRTPANTDWVAYHLADAQLIGG